MSSNLQVIDWDYGLQPIKEVSVTAKQLYDNRKKIMEILNNIGNSILSDKAGLIRIMSAKTFNFSNMPSLNNIGHGKKKSRKGRKGSIKGRKRSIKGRKRSIKGGTLSNSVKNHYEWTRLRKRSKPDYRTQGEKNKDDFVGLMGVIFTIIFIFCFSPGATKSCFSI